MKDQKKSGADCSGPAKATQTALMNEEVTCWVKSKTLSELMQEMNGPISKSLRNEIVKLGELVPQLPENTILECRRTVLALAEICVRVRLLENTAALGLHVLPCECTIDRGGAA
jgi:hypothetical protein